MNPWIDPCIESEGKIPGQTRAFGGVPYIAHRLFGREANKAGSGCISAGTTGLSEATNIAAADEHGVACLPNSRASNCRV